MEAVLNFVTQFHNLDGPTDEKRRKLRAFLDDLGSLNFNFKCGIVYNLKPVTYVEHILYLDVLFRFKSCEKMLQILKSGNEEFAYKMLKKPWFVRKLFQLYSSEKIVGEIFPCLSKVTKYKFVKLSSVYIKDKDIMDNFFDSVSAKYNLDMAKHLLKACSIKKIKSAIDSLNMLLSKRDLVTIFKRDKNLLTYFAEKQIFSWIKLNKKYIAGYIALWCPNMYLNKMCHFPLGKRATRRIIIYDANKIIKNASWFISILHTRTIFKRFRRRESIMFLANLCSKNIETTYDELRIYLSYFPKQHRFKIFAEAFELVNNITIWNIPRKDILENVLKDLTPIPDQIIRTLNISSCDDLEVHLKSVETLNKIVTKLQELQTIGEQINFVKKLVDFSIQLVDSSILKNALYFICNCQKVQVKVKGNFLCYLNSQYDLTNLNYEQWDAIELILNQLGIEKEDNDLRTDIIFKHILYLWRKRMLRELKMTFEYYFLHRNTEHIELCLLDCLELERFLFDPLVENLPIIITQGSNLINKDMSCLKWIIRWNLKKPADRILLENYPRLLDSFEIALQRGYTSHNFDFFFKHLTCTSSKDAGVKRLTHLYFKTGLKTCSEISTIKWHLQYSRKFCVYYRDNWINFLLKVATARSKIWTYLKIYEYSEMVIEFCVGHLKLYYSSLPVFKALALLMSVKDFLRGVKRYLELLDGRDDKTAYEDAKLAVIVSLKYTKSLDAIPLLVELSDQSNLNHVFNSLQFLLLHLQEYNIEHVFDSAPQLSILQKHKPCLYSQIKDFESTYLLFLSTFWKAPNILHIWHLKKIAERYFKKDPSSRVLNLMIDFHLHFKLGDGNFEKQRLNSLFSLWDLPLEFKGKYALQLVEYLKQSVNIDANKVLAAFSHHKYLMLLTPFESASQFIEAYFLNDNTNYHKKALRNFVVYFLCHCNYNAFEKFNLVICQLNEYLMLKTKYHQSARKEVCNVLEAIVTEIWSLLDNNYFLHSAFQTTIDGLALLTAFKSCLLARLPINVSRSTYIKISLLQIFYDSHEKYEKSRKILLLVNDLSRRIHSAKFEILSELALNILNIIDRMMSCSRDSHLEVLSGAFRKYKQSIDAAILFSYLQPEGVENYEERKQELLEIMNDRRYFH